MDPAKVFGEDQLDHRPILRRRSDYARRWKTATDRSRSDAHCGCNGSALGVTRCTPRAVTPSACVVGRTDHEDLPTLNR
jgi:hypothetical protein